MKYWKSYFEYHILERGYEYYTFDQVEIIDISKSKIKAKVEGNSIYNVEIKLNRNMIEKLSCDCPHAKSGAHCKHMAATLFAYTGEDFSEADEDDEFYDSYDDYTLSDEILDDYKEEIDDIIDNTSETILKDFLKSILSNNDMILNQFLMYTNGLTHKFDLEIYIKSIDFIFNKYNIEEHYISCDQSLELANDIEKIIEVDLYNLMDQEEYGNVFEIIKYLYYKVNEYTIDDSYGVFLTFTDSVYTVFAELIENCDEHDKIRIFKWISEQYIFNKYDYYEDLLENILMNSFNSSEYVDEVLRLISLKIEQCMQEKNDKNIKYYVDRLECNYFQFLSKIKGREQEVEKYYEEKADNNEIKKYYIELCIKNLNYLKALEIISRTLEDKDLLNSYKIWYKTKRKEIYFQLGDFELYQKELIELFISCSNGNYDLYQELKHNYSKDEWENIRLDILKQLPYNHYTATILYEEKLDEELVKCIMGIPGLDILNRYIKHIINKYPERVLEKYNIELEQMLLYASSRKQYRNIAFILKEMKKVQGGKDYVNKLIIDLKIRYKNRPAFIDELNSI